MNRYLIILSLCCLVPACRYGTGVSEDAAAAFTEIPSPAGAGGEPNLFVSETGQAYLSWIGYHNDTTSVLYFSALEDGRWREAREIARGSNWFVNWADFPALAAFHGRPAQLAAHWLQKSAGGTYNYDVRIARSADGGRSWLPSFIPHTDGIAAEHGFVSLLPLPAGNMLAVWLDGRNTKGEGETHSGHGHGGPMTLRSAEFDTAGLLYQESALDERVCDCCQTDAAWTPSGPVVVYRDRSGEEVRDISIVRHVNGTWTQPRRLHADEWQIKGCPVNGPAIAAQGASVIVAWYTAARNEPRVKVAFSQDGGQTFADPIVIDDGAPVGRVDVVWWAEDTVVVSWLEEVPEGGEIRLAKVTAAGKQGTSTTATKTGVSRQSGFPILERVGDQLLLAWTSVEQTSTVRTMLISLQ